MKVPSSIFRLFCPITRVDDESRTIEAYAFVNEEVGDGFSLKRKAMEDATPDYMRFANIREMHTRSAAGVTESCHWDSTGALLRVNVVDDAAWQKVKAGVYKGLSVGVKPVIVRGKNVEKCIWYETSLVDRPFDPDALIISRAEGMDSVPDEFEVEEAETEAGELLERIQGLESERAEHAGTIERLESERAGLLERISGLEAESLESKATIERMATENTDLIQRVQTLEKEIEEKPDPTQQKPMKVTAAGLVQRMADVQPSGGNDDAMRAELADLIQRGRAGTMTETEKNAALFRIGEIKRTLGL